MQKKLFPALALIFCAMPTYAFNVDSIGNTSFSMTMLTFFGVGFLLAFTPCILPMLPILTTIILGAEKHQKSSSLKLSTAFVLGMASIYALSGLLAGYLGSSLQTFLQRPFVIVGFASLIALMATSMFGMFNVTMPNFIASRINTISNQQQSNLLGVFIMGMLSTAIASPCITAPMVAILSFITQQGQPIQGAILLFMLALGTGFPLILFAMGQQALLPKSGSWMMEIKQFCGVLLLGLSIWMMHPLLSDNLVVLSFACLAIVSAISFGALDFQKDQPKLLRGVSFIALIYGVTLLLGAFTGQGDLIHPLKAFSKDKRSTTVTKQPQQLFLRVQSLAHVESKIDEAKKLGRPVLLDFHADWCPVCRTLDKNVFADSDIQQLLKNFVLLRVDITQDNNELKNIRQHFAVFGVPTVVLFDRNGVRSSHTGEELNKLSVERKLRQLI